MLRTTGLVLLIQKVKFSGEITQQMLNRKRQSQDNQFQSLDTNKLSHPSTHLGVVKKSLGGTVIIIED